MRKFLFLMFLLSYPVAAYADSVILMIGDGMGKNHLKCADRVKPVYILSLPVKGTVYTHSANAKITDSAAAATAYSCGQKTNNYYLAKLPNTEDCLTIAEEAVQQNIPVGIYSTDYATGATPSAFYAHTQSRKNDEEIEKYKQAASQYMDIVVPTQNIADEVSIKLSELSNNPEQKSFFAMFEGAKIDTYSHDNQYEEMLDELYDFDLAVMKAADFVYKHPDTTLIVLADHETGGLNYRCQFTTNNHTGAKIPVYAYGKHAKLFKGKQDNTDIYKKMHQILFEK
jgi:alkaline phosphatase